VLNDAITSPTKSFELTERGIRIDDFYRTSFNMQKLIECDPCSLFGRLLNSPFFERGQLCEVVNSVIYVEKPSLCPH
jgi:hypothetical protein